MSKSEKIYISGEDIYPHQKMAPRSCELLHVAAGLDEALQKQTVLLSLTPGN